MNSHAGQQQFVKCFPPRLETVATPGSNSCYIPKPGFISINSPQSLYHKIDPQTYTYGFNSSGQLIGMNDFLPNPKESMPKYHEMRVDRGVEWMKQLESTQIQKKKIIEEEDNCSQVAQYFTAENDEGYNEWASKKEEAHKKKIEKQNELQNVPKEIKDLPGHVMPSITDTTNNTYGMYLDIRPKYPAVYPLPKKLAPPPLNVVVKFQNSNMSDHSPIPNHAFAVDPRSMVNVDGCYSRGFEGAMYFPEVPGIQSRAAYTFHRSTLNLLEPVGERVKGYTFPLYSPTGLELNRPVSNCVGVLSGINGQEKFNRKVPTNALPKLFSRYMSYSSYDGGDPETEKNPSKRVKKMWCAPGVPYPPTNPRFNPCSTHFKNQQTKWIPIEYRKPPCEYQCL